MPKKKKYERKPSMTTVIMKDKPRKIKMKPFPKMKPVKYEKFEKVKYEGD